MDKGIWARYLNKSSARQLPKAFEFVKQNIKSENEYNEILDLVLKLKKEMKPQKRIDNLETGVMEMLNINNATNEEIIKVCNKILKKLKWGIEE